MIRLAGMGMCLAVCLAGCSEERAAGKGYRDAADRMVAARTYLGTIAAQEGVKKTPSGLLYRVERPALGGDPPGHRDDVLVHYRGLLVDGDEFDSSYDRNTPVRFAVRDVIAGWREGLKLMREGAQYTFFIPPQLAYGARGRPPVIPPNAALVFEVELLRVYSDVETR